MLMLSIDDPFCHVMVDFQPVARFDWVGIQCIMALQIIDDFYKHEHSKLWSRPVGGGVEVAITRLKTCGKLARLAKCQQILIISGG